MKKIFFTLTMVFLSVYFADAGLAAEAGSPNGSLGRGSPPETLTLDQARLLALANSRSLAGYNLAIKSSQLTEKSRIYSNLPTLSLGASASTGLWNSDEMGDTYFKDNLSTGISIGVHQSIFDGGKSLVQKTLNSIAAEMAQKNALEGYFAVLYETDTAYYGVLQAAASLESAESALQTAELSLSTAEVRSQSGMMNAGDYLQALAEKETKENARNQAKRDLLSSSVKLRNLTGLKETPVPEAFDFDTYEELIKGLAALTDAETGVLYTNLLKTAAVNNPALARAALSSQQAEKNVTLATREYVPTLSASVSTGLNYSGASGTAGGLRPFSGSLSLSGSIPLDFWVTANNVKQKQILRDQAALNYLDAEENLATELQTAFLGLITNAGSVLSTRRAFEYAEKHFEYVMELFRLSQNSVAALSDASALVSSNRNQLIRSQYGFLLSLSNIRKLGAFAEEDALTALLLSASIR
ncbi:hypothetical protein FACS1894110_07590 [Spirochaetia bacterium]|nr:hypothetical protein FACS1894110_07590 [Spirochaetia bacterium]